MLTVLLPLLLALPAWSEERLTPSPEWSPAEVISIQLSALQNNDTPAPDAGIAQTWAFAHPDNQRVTGPLQRFAQMIKSPGYRMLLDHERHEVEQISRADDRADFAVTVTTAVGDVVGYRWSMARVSEGAFAGSWMTVGVSPPQDLGDAI